MLPGVALWHQNTADPGPQRVSAAQVPRVLSKHAVRCEQCSQPYTTAAAGHWPEENGLVKIWVESD